jgi:hypothetical protein
VQHSIEHSCRIRVISDRPRRYCLPDHVRFAPKADLEVIRATALTRISLRSIRATLAAVGRFRGEAQHQYGERQPQNCSCHNQEVGPCSMFSAHKLD